MTLLQRMGWLCRTLWMKVVAPRPVEFTCGHCDRRDRCGMPPSAECVTRAAQIEQGYRLPIHN